MSAFSENVWQSCEFSKMWRIGEFCVGINDHDVKCQYACRTNVFPITFWTGLQMETQIARWSTFKEGCTAWMDGRRVRVCYQIPGGI